MKTILLLRHGKSDRDASCGDDHERPLAKRGRKAAKRIGGFLAGIGQLPDRVLCSSAVRARETLELAVRSGRWPTPIELTPVLYDTSPEAALELIRQQDDALGSLMLVGHEPTWSLLAGGLVGGANLRMPTAALVRIDAAVESWRDVEFGSGMLIWHITPRMLVG
jgi:phosphohistidine phosphatase